MPVILRTSEEIDIWMNAPAEEALQLQRPLPEQRLILLPISEAEDEPLLSWIGRGAMARRNTVPRPTTAKYDTGRFEECQLAVEDGVLQLLGDAIEFLRLAEG